MEEGRSARVFLAVGVSVDVADAVARLQGALAQGAPAGLFRFGDAAESHVTLRFLGQRSGEEQERIARVSGAVARASSPFTVAFGGLGVFPDPRRPHTLWLGLTQGSAALVELAARLEAALAEAGFAPEGRPFVPHLTLARIKRRPEPALMKQLLGGSIGATRAQAVESFALMESRATGAGVRYVPLRVFRLETACTPSK
jgi:RNA 2',3'-cyclic 3'-phosphodiesterase